MCEYGLRVCGHKVRKMSLFSGVVVSIITMSIISRTVKIQPTEYDNHGLMSTVDLKIAYNFHSFRAGFVAQACPLSC